MLQTGIWLVQSGEFEVLKMELFIRTARYSRKALLTGLQTIWCHFADPHSLISWLKPTRSLPFPFEQAGTGAVEEFVPHKVFAKLPVTRATLSKQRCYSRSLRTKEHVVLSRLYAS